MRTSPLKVAPKSFRLAPVAAALAAMAFAPPGFATTYTVTNTAESGAGSLRDAIQTANANCATDPNPIIQFAIPTGPFVISPSGLGALPSFGCGATTYSPTIDGYSAQPTAVMNSSSTWNAQVPVTIDGAALSYGSVCGISAGNLYGGTLKISGVKVSGWNGSNNSGICISGGFLDLKGSIVDGNWVGITGPFQGGLTIGGSTPADRNLITNNSSHGISSTFSGTSIYNIKNNFIGVGPDGVSAAGNLGDGISLQSGSAASSIAFNVIGANSQAGIRLVNQNNMDVNGNFIGVGLDGSTSLPNAAGVYIDTSSGSGITIHDNHLVFNQVGVNIPFGDGVKINHNFVFSNSIKAIQLNSYGGSAPTDNDPGDVDTGSNNLQNFPTIDSVTQGSGMTNIAFTFNSLPSGSFVIEFYANDSVGVNEGKTPLGTLSGTTDTSGVWTGTFTASGIYDNITALATNTATNDTSEFSYPAQFIPSPAVSVVPTTVNFGNVPVSTVSNPQTITVTSTGSGDWYLDSIQLRTSASCYGGTIAYGGGFMYSTTCAPGSSYAPGTGCSISASFAPSFLGPQTVYMCLYDNTSPNFYQTITLTANGVPPPTLSLLSSSYDFGSVSVGSTSDPVRFQLTNPGTTPVTYTLNTSGPFAIASTDCQNPIAGGITCNILTTFKPVEAGLASGALAAIPAAGSPAQSSLFGQGTVGPAFSVPNTIEFVYTLGSNPTLIRLPIKNTGLAPLNFTSIAVTGPGFTLVNDCPASLPPGESCVLTLGFSSSSTGNSEGRLGIASNAGGTRFVDLFGLAQTAPVPVLEVTPRELGYGTRAFGVASPEQVITIRNVGGAPAVISSILSSADFILLGHNCPASLASFASCTARVAMQATAYGQRRGELKVSSNAENSPNLVSLLGTGCRTSGLVLGRLGITSGCRP